jgi:glycosyltransferase involved in cell wall biosynthesis
MVSVIIPNYNHSKYLRQRIDSVLNQTYTDYELIILDDCSDDDSIKIIGEYVTCKPDIITSFNKKHIGNSFAQWNYGVSLAKGEYLWIAESDDSAASTFLDKTTFVLNNNRRVGLVYCDSKILNEQKGISYYSSDISRNRRSARSDDFIEGSGVKYFLDNPIINVSSVLFRRKYFLKVGGADPLMKFCGDWFLYLKMMEISDIHHISEPLNIFRLNSGSTCFSIYKSNDVIKERVIIFSYILKKYRFTLSIGFLMLQKMIKVLAARTFYFLRLNNFINIELPRIPDKKFIVSLERSSLD